MRVIDNEAIPGFLKDRERNRRTPQGGVQLRQSFEKEGKALIARGAKKASNAIRAYIPRGYKHSAVGEGRERERGSTFFAVSKIAESGLRL